MSTSPTATPPAPTRRRVGRPARLSRERIAEAAHHIGFDDLTMKRVADRLGVSVPALYHYVRGRDDLLRLAAEYSAARMQLPTDRGQHWAVWLYEWAVYNRDVFIEQPGLLTQFVEGAIGADRTADTLDGALGALVERGFSIHDARLVYGMVSELAIGAAVAEIRERRAVADDRPTLAELHRVLARRDPGALPHLRALVADATADPGAAFHEKLAILLRGIAATRGDGWPPIAAALADLSRGPDS